MSTAPTPRSCISAALRFLPPRRWFQFRLTTWLVLVAILSWAVLEWPWIVDKQEWIVPQPGSSQTSGRTLRVAKYPYLVTLPSGEMKYRVRVEVLRTTPSLNPALLRPALALAAFIVLKALLAAYRVVTTPGSNRQWFQFGLTTWFVLIAIVAWVMSLWPYYQVVRDRVTVTNEEFTSIMNSPARRREIVEKGMHKDIGNGSVPTWYLIRERTVRNPKLRWPALALAAFIALKAASFVYRTLAARRAADRTLSRSDSAEQKWVAESS